MLKRHYIVLLTFLSLKCARETYSIVSKDESCGGLRALRNNNDTCDQSIVLNLPLDGSGTYNLVVNASLPIQTNETLEVVLENEEAVKNGTTKVLTYAISVSGITCNITELRITQLRLNDELLCENAPYSTTPDAPATKLSVTRTHHGDKVQTSTTTAPSTTTTTTTTGKPMFFFTFGAPPQDRSNVNPNQPIQTFDFSKFDINNFNFGNFGPGVATASASSSSSSAGGAGSAASSGKVYTQGPAQAVSNSNANAKTGDTASSNVATNSANPQFQIPGNPGGNPFVGQDQSDFSNQLANNLANNLGNNVANKKMTRQNATVEPSSGGVIQPQILTDPSPVGVDVADICGHSSQALIRGGNDVNPGEFPWFGALFQDKNDGTKIMIYICTVNLVSERYVITAADCVIEYELEPEVYGVLMGLVKHRDYARVHRIHVHPDFRRANLSHNIAILRMRERIEFSSTLKPICLWPAAPGQQQSGGDSNNLGMLAGFGPDYTAFRKLQMPLVAVDECRSSSHKFHAFTSEFTFCAGTRNNTGPCLGDSGAGYMQWFSERYYLRGLVSQSLIKVNAKGVDCDLKHYVVFSDLSKEMSWVNNTLKLA